MGRSNADIPGVLNALGIDEDEDNVEHHGVKGQKWGVRRSRSARARAGGASKTKKTSKAEPFAKKAPKAPKKMSDQELKKVINRMNMEKQYKDLTAPKASPAKKFVTEVLVNVGKQQATAYANKGAQMAIEAMIKKAAK